MIKLSVIVFTYNFYQGRIVYKSLVHLKVLGRGPHFASDVESYAYHNKFTSQYYCQPPPPGRCDGEYYAYYYYEFI